MTDIFTTAEPFHPGEYIADELEARGWTQDDLAEITGVSRRHVINLIQGRSGITADTAHRLAQAFGHEPISWMNLQAAYELAVVAQADRDVKRKADVFNKVPVRELIRRGWINETDDVGTLEREVCSLLKIEKISDEVNLQIAARKSTSYDTETGAQIAWYGQARRLAEGAHAGTYAPELIESGLPELLKLAGYPEDARVVPKVLAGMGIRLVLLEHLRHTKIDGVAFWLDAKSPAIALSLRYDRIDNFWYTLLHELAHIKEGHSAPIDVDIMRSQGDANLPEDEVIANRMAAQWLIPTNKIDGFIARVKPHYYEAKIVQFAQSVGVHPGIVIGQLQYHPNSGFEFKQLRRHLVKVRDQIVGNAVTDGWRNRPSI